MLPPIQYITTDGPFSIFILNIYYLTIFKMSGSLRFLFILSISFLLPSSLFFLSSEESMSLWGIVARPGKQGALCRNSSADDLLLSLYCSQLILWHTVLMPLRVPSECCTAASASPFDCGEYAANSSWLISVLFAHSVIALLAAPNWGPPSEVRSSGGPYYTSTNSSNEVMMFFIFVPGSL